MGPRTGPFPATLRGRVQTSFNTSSIRSRQRKTLSGVGPRDPSTLVAGSALALSQSLCRRGSSAGDDPWVSLLLVSGMWLLAIDGVGEGSGYGLSGNECGPSDILVSGIFYKHVGFGGGPCWGWWHRLPEIEDGARVTWRNFLKVRGESSSGP